MLEECRPYREELTALRRGEGPTLPAGELESHLEQCSECRRAEDGAGRLFALLDEYQPSPAAGGRDRLRVSISTGKYRPGLSGPAARRRAVSIPAAAAVAAAAFLAALWLGSRADRGTKPPVEEPGVAVLTGARGMEVLGAKGAAPTPGEVLRAGTRCQVAPDGHARLVMHRGARVELAGGSVFALDAADGIFIEKGRLLAAVRKGGRPFRVRTPVAEVVTLGTRFTVAAGEGSTKVAVAEGRVRFTRLGDGSVEVGARQASAVLAGKAPSVPAAATPEELAWVLGKPAPKLELELTPDKVRLAPGERLTARLRLVNRSGRAVSVDGTGRGRSSYFLRVEDPSGGRSHFCPRVVTARVDGILTRAPLVLLKEGGSYELELDLGGFGRQPGEYRLAAIYLESTASATTDWSGAVESAACGVVVTAPPGTKKRLNRGTPKGGAAGGNSAK